MRGDLAVILGVVVFAVATMPVYAVTARHKPDPLDVARGGFVLGTFVRSWFYWFVDPVVRLALALRLSPTAFNVLGVLFGVAAGIAFGMGHRNLGGWGVLLGGAADVLDGRIARARDMADDRGVFLDATLDRFAEVAAFVGLAVFYRDSVLATALVALALGSSLLVSYAKARGETVGVMASIGVMQRAERLLLIGFGGLFDPAVTEWLGWAPGDLLIWAIGLVAVGATITALYRTVWIARRLG